MSLPAWTRQRTTWHQPKLGWISLPPGLRCHRVWLDELPTRERTIFKNVLKRSPDHVLVRLAGKARAVSKTTLLEINTMTDATDLEQAAMAAALRPLGEYVGSIGMHRPLTDYTRQEVLTLVEVIITTYQDYFNKYNDDIPF
ncbi:MAG: hypothetical protein HQL64_12690 [Magnetococcales bacterium]|nr:hypothetical protein [Magnetococcales bacterium]